MVVYNIALAQGGLNNQIFLISLYELPIMGIIAFILEGLFVEKLAIQITFKTLDAKNTQPIFITIFMSCMIVCLMCPSMSLVAILIHHHNDGINMISTWIQTTVLNFPMALCLQLFLVGPLVRSLFNLIFNKKQTN